MFCSFWWSDRLYWVCPDGWSLHKRKLHLFCIPINYLSLFFHQTICQEYFSPSSNLTLCPLSRRWLRIHSLFSLKSESRVSRSCGTCSGTWLPEGLMGSCEFGKLNDFPSFLGTVLFIPGNFSGCTDAPWWHFPRVLSSFYLNHYFKKPQDLFHFSNSEQFTPSLK